MWERVSNLASFVTGEEGNEGVPAAGGESQQGAAVGGDPTEGELQQMEQERLIVHLKEMIRQSEKSATERDAELKKVQAEFSKFRLQSKSKIASLSAQAEQAHKSMSESMERASIGSDESSNTMASEASTSSVADQKSRARNLVLKKRIADKDRRIAEKDRALEARGRELEAKMRVISERDAVVESVRTQLEVQGGVIERLQAQLTTGGADEGVNEITRRQLETRMAEMIAQMVQKDNQIIDLANEITERDKKVMDLQECVSEKDEVIRGRNQAIALLQAASKQAAEGSGLQHGRDQEAFAEVLQAMEQRLIESKELVSSKEKIINQLRAEASDMDLKLQAYSDEHVRMEQLIADQAETIRTSLSESKLSTEGEHVSMLSVADARLAEQDEEIHQLKARLEEATAASSDNKLSKFKSLAGSKIKALEKELEELKQGGDLREEVAALRNHVAELEEEKGTMQLLLLDLEDKQGIVSTSSSPVPDLQPQLTSLHVEYSNLSQVNIMLQTEVERLNGCLEQARQQQTELRASMNSSIDHLTNLLQTSTNELGEKTKMVAFFEEQMKHVNIQLETCNNELGEKSRANVVLEDQIRHMNQQLEESNKEVGDQARMIAALDDSMKLVNNQLDESKIEAGERARMVTALEDQIRQLVDFHRRNLEEIDVEKNTTTKILEVELARVIDVYKELQNENARLNTIITDQLKMRSTQDSLQEDRCIKLERELGLLRCEQERNEEKLVEKELEMTRLKNELSEMRNDTKQQSEVKELELAKKDAQIQNLSTLLTEKEELIVRFGLELKQKEEFVERCTSNLKEEENTALSRLLAAESAVAERDMMLRATATSIEERNSRIAELEAKIEQKDALLNSHVSDVSSLSDQLQDAVAEREKLMHRLQELSESKESERMLLAEKEMRLKEILSDVDRSSEESQLLKASLDIAAGQNRFLQESLEKLEKQISERDQSICTFQDDVKLKTEEAARLSATLERLQASSEERLHTEDLHKDEEISSLKALVEKLQSAMIEKQKEIETAKSELDNFQQNLDVAEKKIADRDKKIGSLSENYQEEEAQLVALTEELENIRVELASEKNNVKSMEGVLASKAAEIGELADLMEKKDAKKKKVPTATLR